MIRNYIKITLRNIFKHKGYSFINIAGLAAGMACCLLIAIWVLDELSYDKFHQNISSLYRVEENQHYSGRQFHVNVTPYPLSPALKEEIAEIANSSRFVWAGSHLLRYGENAFYENNVRAVDPSFFQMFSFPVLTGDETTLLDSPYSLVITEDIASKYFGDVDPMGRVIVFDNQHEFTVTGVVRNVPHNSTIQFDMLLPYEFLRKEGKTREDDFGSNSILTYVQLKENVNLSQANEKVFGFIRTKSPKSTTDLVLRPLSQIHLHAYFGYKKTMGAIQYIYIFSIIAFFVLLIACINFMNLSTARSAKRAREVGMRKVVGALKTHLIRQFYGESLLFTVIALIFAVLLVTLLLPAFSSLAGKDLSWNVTGISNILLGILGITLFSGLVAGSYPALVLSSFQPVKVIRGAHRSKRGGIMFRRILVVLQFSLSILLIIGTVVVYKQLHYMKNVRLGWDKEHLLYIPLRADIQKSYQSLKDELIKDTRILGVTGTSQLPSYINSNSGGVDWEGKDPQQQVLIGFNFVDYDYIKTLDIEMTEGRAFSKEFPSDLSQTFIVNEEVVTLMDKESVVGERFHFMGVDGTIVGVMKNFHYQPVQNRIEPLAILVVPDYIQYMLIRIPPENISASLKFIENTWNRIFPNYPFDYQFIDENFDRMYRAEERIGTLLKYFAFLAVLIACLGLFGLASFTAEQRTKEIGIRKVLGASVGQVTFLLCREFFLLVLLSNLIAWPLAYLAMEDWLNNYAYRTKAGIIVFLAAMLTALAVALLSVAFQAIKAALANPANALKYE